MDEKEKTFEIAQEFIRMQAETEALRRVLNRSWNDPNNPWENYVSQGTDQILNLEITHQRYDQLRSAFDSASDGDFLIRALHDEILRRAQVS